METETEDTQQICRITRTEKAKKWYDGGNRRLKIKWRIRLVIKTESEM